jgi:hypothetical protein
MQHRDGDYWSMPGAVDSLVATPTSITKHNLPSARHGSDRAFTILEVLNIARALQLRSRNLPFAECPTHHQWNILRYLQSSEYRFSHAYFCAKVDSSQTRWTANDAQESGGLQ